MSFLRRTVRYFSALLKNVYFWGGLALLVLLIFGAYLLFDRALMPQYTRYGVSVTVPEVTGQSLAEARQALSEHDLHVEEPMRTYTPSLPRDVVVEQRPAQGASVKPGRRVYLTINSGETPMVSVPQVADLSLREAKNRLQAVGLKADDVREDSIPSPYKNTVTRQRPAASDSLPKGSGVTLWYSTGLGQSYATVPDVTGMTVEAAKEALLERRLRSVVVHSDENGGQGDTGSQEVNRQSLDAGARVREGFEVRLYVDG